VKHTDAPDGDQKRYGQRISSKPYASNKRIEIKTNKDDNRNYVKAQNPAIPFPQSQKHYSSKLNTGSGYEREQKENYSYLDRF
jgi:hypothetical protein